MVRYIQAKARYIAARSPRSKAARLRVLRLAWEALSPLGQLLAEPDGRTTW